MPAVPPSLRALLLCALCGTAVLPVQAQIKNRWRIEWSNRKPRLFTYQDPLGRKTNYLYVVYTIKNPTPEMVPIAVDVTLHTDHGGDLHHDVRHVQPPVAHPGKWYADTMQPIVETEIVKAEEGLRNLSPGLALERIEELKKEGRYLNPMDLRARHVIRPGESLSGVALFADVDMRTDILELNVSGLIDVVKVDKVTPEGVQYVYDNQVRKVFYAFSGDEFERQSDTVVWTGEKWETQQIGPVAEKTTVAKLVENLSNPDDPVIRSVAIALLKQVTPNRDGYGYDPAKSVEDNLAAVRKWNEWWIRNMHRLVYNSGTNAFDVKEETLPGTSEPFPDEKSDPAFR